MATKFKAHPIYSKSGKVVIANTAKKKKK